MQLKKANRKQVKLRLGLSGASGFGKTASALIMAYGMTGDWSKIAVIDTENESASLYANHSLPNGVFIGEFQTISLSHPYTPERYIQAIKACEAESEIEVIIIDSITHEWDGKGGCLDIQSELGGKYQDWAKVSPRHQAFITSILQSKCHVITTVRRKQDYEMTKDNNGRLTVQKTGTKEITRDGFEYELTVNFELVNDKHLCKSSKDRTSLFSSRPEFIITPEIGKELIEWCNKGKDELLEAIADMESCKTLAALQASWTKWKKYQSVPSFMSAKEDKKIELSPETT